MIDRQEFTGYARRLEQRAPIRQGSEHGTIIFKLPFPMADATPVEQFETPESAPSPLLEKIGKIVIPRLVALKDESATEQNGFNLARATLLLAEADPGFTASTHDNKEKELVAQEITDNLEHGYNTGPNADKWAQSIALASFKTAYAGQPQPDLFNIINAGLIGINRSGETSLWWEQLDKAVYLAAAFPERIAQLETGDVEDLQRRREIGDEENHPSRIIKSRFWGIMKEMFDKAKNGELIPGGNDPVDLAGFKVAKDKAEAVKLQHGARARTVEPNVKDRFASNDHAVLYIGACIANFRPEMIPELGLTVDDIKEREESMLHNSQFPFYRGTPAETFALGEMYVSARSLEKTFAQVRKFPQEQRPPQKPGAPAASKVA